jgi:cytidylate kinase
MAEEAGMTMLERDKLGDKPENRKEFDLKYEEYQKSLDPTSKIILDGRMAFWCQPTAFNVFLDVDLDTSAHRIHESQRSLNQ